MVYGYMGKVLRVNLTEEKISIESLPSEDILRKWLGGRGIGTYYIIKEVPPNVDPLSPENKLIIATGPVTGIAGIPTAGRWSIVTKSPITNTVYEGNAGGKFGAELKFSGFDFIIIEGKANRPVYLWIYNGKAEIRDAKNLWGKTVYQTVDLIREELSSIVGKDDAKNIKVISIGPAGEKLVKISAVIEDKGKGAVGRGGIAAVFGSKNLKAIAVRGNLKPQIANQEKFREVILKSSQFVRNSAITSIILPKYGTAGFLAKALGERGMIPVKNYQTNVFLDFNKLSGETIVKEYLDQEKTRESVCWGCPIGCKKYTKVDKPLFSTEGDGPEYMGVWGFGYNLNNDNLPSVLRAYHLCNELGLDIIGTGHVIGTFIELVEKGKIPKEKLEGLKVNWGDPELIIELIYRIANRIGIGDELSEGTKEFAKKYNSEEYAMVNKRGMPLFGFDPRGAQGYGLWYATSNTGDYDQLGLFKEVTEPTYLGNNNINRFETKGKGELIKKEQDLAAVIDSMIVCRFSRYALNEEIYAEQLSAVTGWDINSQELLKIGERIWNAERVYNILVFGDNSEYDNLPKRFLEEPFKEGPSAGYVVKISEMLPEYYKARGWINGRPTREKLEELDLKWLADILEEKHLLP
jgi:aldehyde:ferredoxin oxidoreductase